MGVILVLFASFFFVSSTYFGKVVTNSTEMTAIVTSFSRYLLGTILMVPYIIITKKSFKADNMKPIVYRAIFNSFASMFLAMSLLYTTLTNSTLLNSIYPVFVIIIVPLITKQKIKKSTYIYLAAVVLGSYIVADPSFSSVNRGDLIAIISSFLAAMAVIYLSDASKSNEGYIIIFYVMLISAVLNFPFAYRDLANFDFNGIVPVILASICGILGQVFLTWGYKYVDPPTGSLVSSSRVIFSAIFGVLLLNEPINLRIILGVLLIFSSLVGVSGYFENKLNRGEKLIE